jgi:glycosyltransferase involved in cell wall biosynthesis
VSSLRDHLDVEEVSFAATSRLRTVFADVAWYPRLHTDADVLHCPTFRGPFRARQPLVVTVHDLAVLRHPEWFNRWTATYSRLAVPRVVRAARRVIAVSKFTKGELVSLLGTPPEKITVVPNAVEDVFVPEGARAEGDYVLAVGTLEPRKNLEVAIAATRGRELRIVGGRGWGGVEARGEHVTWLGPLHDEQLARQYRGAAAVVYPSRFEGFGMPVVEAMACGTPVVASSHPSLDEASGDAALRADPDDPDAVAAVIDEAIARRDELVPRGVEHARRFTWEANARAHLEAWS